METIRILFYTDDSMFNLNPNDEKFSLYRLKRIIERKTGSIADVKIDLINRHFNGELKHAVNKLTRALLCDYDELWIFGLKVINQPPDASENELTAAEVMELERWMSTGGVLITGDHANPRPDDPDLGNNLNTYLNLGRALGYKVPRAGQLRVWEGPPTTGAKAIEASKPLCERDNFNTQVPPEGVPLEELDNTKHEEDSIPQELMPQEQIHRLFWRHVNPDGSITPISRFPDHMHEGKLVIPTSLNNEWPNGSPFPVVAAQGTDKRCEGKVYDLVVAYDGDQANVGRIVANSSWHHYLNVNLLQLIPNPEQDPPPGSDAAQIEQYYVNLVIWLAPKVIRDRLGRNILFRLATDPSVREVERSSLDILGATAQTVLAMDIGLDNVLRLFMPAPGEQNTKSLNSEEIDARVINDLLVSLALTCKCNEVEIAPTEQRDILGSIVRDYHHKFNEKGISDPGYLKSDPISTDEFTGIIFKAFLSQSSLATVLSASTLGRFLSAEGEESP